MEEIKVGSEIYEWSKDLFPLNRSLTGQGVRDTLNYINQILPDLEIKSVSSGEQYFDWIIPKEWNVKDAYIIDPLGFKIVDFKVNNLHLAGYSTPVNDYFTLDQLKKHLFYIPEQSDAIPYITSYYSENWGFCITYNQFLSLKDGLYKVVIDSSLENGVMNYGECLIKGESATEVLLSTYICHPSMANNEISGIVVTTAIAKWLYSVGKLKYSYRIVFVPETIGSICYISKNYQNLRENTLGGFVVTCVGDDNNYSLLKSKNGDTIFDKIGEHVLKFHTNNTFKTYSFLQRGSDERQYSSVGVDLPIVSLMRSKYGEYKEYHTSLDNLNFISPDGLNGGYLIHKMAIEILEKNEIYKTKFICEPQLGKRGLYPLQSDKNSHKKVELMMNIIAYSDGKKNILDISEEINSNFFDCLIWVEKLRKENILI